MNIFCYDKDYEDVILKKTEKAYIDKLNEYLNDGLRVIIEEDATAGWMYYSIPKASVYSGFVFIYIFEEFRRKGIGTRAYRYVERQFKETGCNWWTSYPASDSADAFALAVGFDYINKNYYMEHNDMPVDVPSEGIRECTSADFSAADELWRREYADMHIRIGLPYKKREETEEMKAEAYSDFCAHLGNYYVIEENGKIVAYGALFSDGSGIGAVAVDREHTGKGYGTQMAAFLTNECIRRGCKKPCLYCEHGNDDAIHIYKKLGYTIISCESGGIKNDF